jgi:hypothetical protein
VDTIPATPSSHTHATPARPKLVALTSATSSVFLLTTGRGYSQLRDMSYAPPTPGRKVAACDTGPRDVPHPSGRIFCGSGGVERPACATEPSPHLLDIDCVPGSRFYQGVLRASRNHGSDGRCHTLARSLRSFASFLGLSIPTTPPPARPNTTIPSGCLLFRPYDRPTARSPLGSEAWDALLAEYRSRL